MAIVRVLALLALLAAACAKAALPQDLSAHVLLRRRLVPGGIPRRLPAREGGISRQAFLRGISGIAAHEMGHLLGIIGHSTRTDVLMGPTFHDAPTIADVNTLIRAYCHT